MLVDPDPVVFNLSSVTYSIRMNKQIVGVDTGFLHTSDPYLATIPSSKLIGMIGFVR